MNQALAYVRKVAPQHLMTIIVRSWYSSQNMYVCVLDCHRSKSQNEDRSDLHILNFELRLELYLLNGCRKILLLVKLVEKGIVAARHDSLLMLLCVELLDFDPKSMTCEEIT